MTSLYYNQGGGGLNSAAAPFVVLAKKKCFCYDIFVGDIGLML
jgi:hypothetical protein